MTWGKDKTLLAPLAREKLVQEVETKLSGDAWLDEFPRDADQLSSTPWVQQLRAAIRALHEKGAIQKPYQAYRGCRTEQLADVVAEALSVFDLWRELK